MARECPNCYAPVTWRARYCPRCGHALVDPPAGDAAPASAPPAPSPATSARESRLGWFFLIAGMALVVGAVLVLRLGPRACVAGTLGVVLLVLGLGTLVGGGPRVTGTSAGPDGVAPASPERDAGRAGGA